MIDPAVAWITFAPDSIIASAIYSSYSVVSAISIIVVVVLVGLVLFTASVGWVALMSVELVSFELASLIALELSAAPGVQKFVEHQHEWLLQPLKKYVVAFLINCRSQSILHLQMSLSVHLALADLHINVQWTTGVFTVSEFLLINAQVLSMA